MYWDLEITGTYFSSGVNSAGDSTLGDNSSGVSSSRGLFSRYIVQNFGYINYLVTCFLGIASSWAVTCCSCVFLFWGILSSALTDLSRSKHVLDPLTAKSNNCPLELVELSSDTLITKKTVTYLWDAKGCHNISCAYRWSFLTQWQGSLWVTQIEYDSLTSKLESNPHLMSTTKILSLRYLDLPSYLKSSFKVVSYLSWLYGWSFLLASCTNIFFQECGLNSMTNLYNIICLYSLQKKLTMTSMHTSY